MLRLHPPLLTNLDDWIGLQTVETTRPEAIRRLVEQALAASDARLTGRAGESKRGPGGRASSRLKAHRRPSVGRRKRDA